MKLGNPEMVGQMMRERRHKLGFTIEQMAEAVGLAPITILRIEKGRVGYVHEKTAKALEVPAKITNRYVITPTAVMPDGSSRPVGAVKAMPPELMAAFYSGDSEALPAAPEPILRKPAPVRRRVVHPAVAPKLSIRQRVFSWLRDEFEALAK